MRFDLKTIIAKPLTTHKEPSPSLTFEVSLLERVQAFLADDEEFVFIPPFRVTRG